MSVVLNFDLLLVSRHVIREVANMCTNLPSERVGGVVVGSRSQEN